MTKAEAPPRGQWRLTLAAAVTLIGLTLFLSLAIQSCRGDVGAGEGAPGIPLDAREQTPEKMALRAAIEEKIASAPTRITEEDRALAAIKEHEEELDANPTGPDVPARLNAMGNLYSRKLQDYRAAAKCYEQIVLAHADWEGVYAVYPQLEVCYEALNDDTSLLWLYRTMVDRYPRDSQEYLFAQEKLRLKF